MTDASPGAAPPQRLPVAILWHMHQPQYKDALTGEYAYPWTLLHALKDYSDMAAHLEQNTSARAVVNFAPILLEQLAELASQIAAHLRDGSDVPDPILALLTEVPIPEERTRRLELLQALLRVQRTQMVVPLPVFAELTDLAMHLATPDHVTYASDEFIVDLAVWYHIAWIGETIRRSDPRVGVLMKRGRAFRLDERRMLLAIIADTLAGLIPRYRALAASGRVEIAVSPYAHPILPLLCDFGAAREAWKDSPLPRSPEYPGGRERAVWQLREAVRVYTELFGARPLGCWPSEGAISDEALALIEQAGFRWAASSASVLRNSLARAFDVQAGDDDPVHCNRAYRLSDRRLSCFFRHDTLSDLVGFTYSSWHGDDAVAHFVAHLEQLAVRYQGQAERIVLVALDGENAWEHYPQNGFHFLRGLYAALAKSPRLELTTLGAFTAKQETATNLPHVVAGSWVHGTLSTWMGDADKNAAWDLLCAAKRDFDRVTQATGFDGARLEGLTRQLALCESSDWFWWFGDYNPSDAVRQFDLLFRRQLATLYRMLGVDAPTALATPLSRGGGAPEGGGVMRRTEVG